MSTAKGNRERIVILGSGWAGFVLSRDLDTKKFEPVIISPRSHFVFTPLISQASVGTTEFRSIVEPIRNKNHDTEFFQGWADSVDLDKKTIQVEESIFDPNASVAHLPGDRDTVTPKTKGQVFEVTYDKLVVAVGAYAQTFGTKGVKDYAMFMKDVGDGRQIRKRVLELFEVAGLPTFTDEVRRCLLHFAIVGGGPTGMEFAAELRDLIHEDLSKVYPDLIKFTQISVYDVAPKVLPMFDENLAAYAMETFKREGIKIKTSHHIEELRRGLPEGMPAQPLNHEERKGGCYTLKIKEEGEVGIGLCVWSTGNTGNPFLERAFGKPIKLPLKSAMIEENSSKPPSSPATDTDPDQRDWIIQRHPKTGGLVVTDRFQVQLETDPSPISSKDSKDKGPEPTRAIMRDVYALGDCSNLSYPLPATAQVANQEAKWLAKHLNRGTVDSSAFNFKDLGVMTYIGGSKALMQGGKAESDGEGGDGVREKSHRLDLKGKQAYWLWKGAYLSMTISWKNRILVATHWVLAKVFGRDITRF